MLFLLNESISKNWQVKVARVNRVDYLRQFDLAKRLSRRRICLVSCRHHNKLKISKCFFKVKYAQVIGVYSIGQPEAV